MKERKYGCQGEVKAITGDVDKWYEENKWLIEPLGYSRNNAFQHRGKIDALKKELINARWQILSIALIPLLLLS